MPPLTNVERQHIDNGPWFSKLSLTLQQARRYGVEEAGGHPRIGLVLEREGVLRVKPSRLIVLSPDKLLALADPA